MWLQPLMAESVIALITLESTVMGVNFLCLHDARRSVTPSSLKGGSYRAGVFFHSPIVGLKRRCLRTAPRPQIGIKLSKPGLNGCL